MNGPLFQLRDLLRRRGMASAAQLAAELRLPAGVVEDMLAHWSRRGLVAGAEAPASGACGSGGGCASCGQCASAAAPAVLYRWREAQAQRQPRSIPILARA
jgi:FeoC like transcriptional regulator